MITVNIIQQGVLLRCKEVIHKCPTYKIVVHILKKMEFTEYVFYQKIQYLRIIDGKIIRCLWRVLCWNDLVHLCPQENHLADWHYHFDKTVHTIYSQGMQNLKIHWAFIMACFIGIVITQRHSGLYFLFIFNVYIFIFMYDIFSV